VTILAHRNHRVEWTSPDESTVWLAVFFSNKCDDRNSATTIRPAAVRRIGETKHDCAGNRRLTESLAMILHVDMDVIQVGEGSTASLSAATRELNCANKISTSSQQHPARMRKKSCQGCRMKSMVHQMLTVARKQTASGRVRGKSSGLIF